MIALLNNPTLSGEMRWIPMLFPPADSPNRVTFVLSPPKFPMFACTHLRAGRVKFFVSGAS